MGIGSRIKQRRESLGMTQEDLAFKLGYKSRSTINKIENGARDVSQSKLFGFANALRTSPEYLLGYSSPNEASVSSCEFVDILFKDGTSATITTNNQRFLECVKMWSSEFSKIELTNDEMEELMNYAKFIVMKRK